MGVEGYIGCDKSLVRSVNGVKVRGLRHLVELVDSCKYGFVCFGLDRDNEWDVKVIVDAKEMREATARVMKRAVAVLMPVIEASKSASSGAKCPAYLA